MTTMMLSERVALIRLCRSVFTGGDYERLPAQERGGDVQERSGGGGTLGNHGVSAGRSFNKHRV